MRYTLKLRSQLHEALWGYLDVSQTKVLVEKSPQRYGVAVAVKKCVLRRKGVSVKVE